MSSRLRIEHVDCKIDGLLTQARVELSLTGKSSEGLASARSSDAAWQRVIAEATIDSVRRFVSGHVELALDTVMEVTSGRYPLIVVTLTVTNGSRELFLSGTAPTVEGRYTAVAKAVLHGLNRLIEEYLS